MPSAKCARRGQNQIYLVLPRRRLSKRRLCPPQSGARRGQNQIYLVLPRRRLSKRRLRPPQSGARRRQKQPAIGNLRIKIRNSVPSSRGCVRIGCCRSCGSKSAEHAHSGGPPRAEASARAALSAAMLQQGIVTARQDAVLIAWRLLLPSLIRIFARGRVPLRRGRRRSGCAVRTKTIGGL